MIGEHFFIAGAQRSGTSYLYCLLDEHPEIEMAKPLQPEPKFFLMDELFGRGLEYYRSRYFSESGAAWLRGEKSTSYMESEKAARRISGCFPQAKILFLLRDPIERAISNYWFSRNNGFETLPMSEAFLREEERRSDYDPRRVSVSPFAYLSRGRYIEHIIMYERFFPAENMKVMVYEAFVGSLNLVRDLYAFLGVNPDFVPHSLHEVVNNGDKGDSTLSPELEHYLVDYFAESNTRLAQHLGLDLAAWKRW